MKNFWGKIIKIWDRLCSDDEYYKTLKTYKRNNSCPICGSVGVVDRFIPAHTTTRLIENYEVHTFAIDLMLRRCDHCDYTWHEMMGQTVLKEPTPLNYY